MSNSIYILGISAYYHDSAACLLRDGQIVAAAQEERFSRKKHDPDFPLPATRGVPWGQRWPRLFILYFKPLYRMIFIGFSPR